MSFTLSSLVCYEEEIKKSRFQALAMPVEHEQAVKACLEMHKDPTTTHQCWAWKIGDQVKFNDDGEPSGTAGRPILAMIEGQDFTNILILVNRWYGGIKLGTGGLVRAYGGCAAKCLVLAEKIELIVKKCVSFCCFFNEWPILQYELNTHQVEYQETYTAEGVEVTGLLCPQQIAFFSLKLQDITRGRVQLKVHDER